MWFAPAALSVSTAACAEGVIWILRDEGYLKDLLDEEGPLPARALHFGGTGAVLYRRYFSWLQNSSTFKF